MSDIQRYRYSDGWDNFGYPCHHVEADGSWVEYKDHLAIVEKLKAEIADLKVKAEEAYNEGYGVGNSVGYCQGLMGED